MTTQEQFYALRERLIAEINRIREEGEPGKSYEGRFEIYYKFPDASDCWESIINKPCEVVIYLHSYLVGPARHYEWRGKTLNEALAKCEKDVFAWIEENE